MPDRLKPKCKLLDKDGNVFNIMFNIIGLVIGALKSVGLTDQADEFRRKSIELDNYDAVLVLCKEYVDIY